MLFLPARGPAPGPAAPPPAELAPMSGTWRQIAATVAVATIVAWLSPYWPRGPWNLALWFGAPTIIACTARNGAARLLVAPLLWAIFPLVVIGNEVAAHIFFDLCLQD